MTLLKCISLTALLSGASTAAGDTTDNVSSRLQVHVRDEKIGLGFSGGRNLLGFLYLALYLYLFCIISSALSVCHYFTVDECSI